MTRRRKSAAAGHLSLRGRREHARDDRAGRRLRARRRRRSRSETGARAAAVRYFAGDVFFPFRARRGGARRGGVLHSPVAPRGARLAGEERALAVPGGGADADGVPPSPSIDRKRARKRKRKPARPDRERRRRATSRRRARASAVARKGGRRERLSVGRNPGAVSRVPVRAFAQVRALGAAVRGPEREGGRSETVPRHRRRRAFLAGMNRFRQSVTGEVALDRAHNRSRKNLMTRSARSFFFALRASHIFPRRPITGREASSSRAKPHLHML